MEIIPGMFPISKQPATAWHTRAHNASHKKSGALHLRVRSRRANEHIKVRMFQDEDVWGKKTPRRAATPKETHAGGANALTAIPTYYYAPLLYLLGEVDLCFSGAQPAAGSAPAADLGGRARFHGLWEQKRKNAHMEIAWHKTQRCITPCG